MKKKIVLLVRKIFRRLGYISVSDLYHTVYKVNESKAIKLKFEYIKNPYWGINYYPDEAFISKTEDEKAENELLKRARPFIIKNVQDNKVSLELRVVKYEI